MSAVIGYLIGQAGEISGLRVAVPDTGLIIGRDPKDADLVVDHPLVSRRHAQIAVHQDGRLFLLDLQSRNGTFVNGRRLTAPVFLSPNDKIELGAESKVVFVFESVATTSLTGVLNQAFGDNFAPVKWKPGDVIGGEYEVHGTLGKGGFGVVYLVRDHRTGEVCALKTFRDEFLADGNAREAFKKEAILWVNLDEHAFILPAGWVEEFSGRLFVEMEYVAPDGQDRVSLADHLAKAAGPLDVDQSIEWAIQFSLGMEHANAHGIKCHRDIKPANILITQEGTLKITDFGLAAAAEIAWRTSGRIADSIVSGSEEGRFNLSVLQEDGKVRCGTPGYMPPEVYRGETADVRSDIYSFGLVLWQMATGSKSPPFVVPYRGNMGDFLREVYERQMTGRPPRINRPLWTVVKRCLKANPTKRYRDFGELRDDLAAIFLKQTGRTFRVPEDGERTSAFWNNKGASLNALGRRAEAIGCYDKALEIDGRDAAAWTNKGNALHALGRCEQAVDCYDRALEIDPRYAIAWSNKGGSLNSLGRHEEAIDCYDKALEIDPRKADAWNNKGCILAALGRREQAVDCYDKALEIDPRKADAWNNKGTALGILGRRQEAIGCYDKALNIHPRYAIAWTNKGCALDALGRREEAIGCHDMALEIDPRFASAWRNKAVSLHVLGRHEEVIDCCDKVLAIDPRNAIAWYGKALAQDVIGNSSDAARNYRRFLELEPTQDSERIALVRQRLKELEEELSSE